jgi:SAM-dependent methyltransferase
MDFGNPSSTSPWDNRNPSAPTTISPCPIFARLSKLDTLSPLDNVIQNFGRRGNSSFDTVVETTNHRNISFPKHPLTNKYLGEGQGIELGAAAHNSFHLPGSINVAPDDDYDFYRDAQVGMCGAYAEIDIVGEAHELSRLVPPNSQDYVISSHVVEHLANPIAAFLDWNRVLKPGGIIFMILPQPDAHPGDRKLSISTLDELVTAYRAGYTVDSFPGAVNRRGHYWRFTLRLMEDLIQWCNDFLDLDWQLVETEDPDRKVGNGWTLIAQWKPLRHAPSGECASQISTQGGLPLNAVAYQAVTNSPFDIRGCRYFGKVTSSKVLIEQPTGTIVVQGSTFRVIKSTKVEPFAFIADTCFKFAAIVADAFELR